MAKKTVTCDVCGVEMSAADAWSDAVHETDFCLEHYRQYQLDDARSARDILQSRMEQTHLKKLRELDAMIAKLEAQKGNK